MSTFVRKNLLICLAFLCILVLSFVYHFHSFQLSPTHWISKIQGYNFFSEKKEPSLPKPKDTYEKVNDLFDVINRTIPHVDFTDLNEVTCGAKSRATIQNNAPSYCVGDLLTVRVEMYDFLARKKTYGGDFLRARIFSPEHGAGASGRVEDFNNGTYDVHFTLFWEGLVNISIVLLHPSEGVSTLWKVRNIGYQYILFTGKFLNKTEEVHTPCGFYLNSEEELCEYVDEKYEEVFRCIKPPHVACGAFISLTSRNSDRSYLTKPQKIIFARSNNGIKIPMDFDSVRVLRCNNYSSTNVTKCKTGMSSPFPSGYFYENQWYPANCVLPALPPIEKCLAGKMIYFMGDSTLRQWIEYFPRLLKTLKYFDNHGTGWHKTHLAIDSTNNIQIQWKKHGHPFITKNFFNMKDHSYIANEIDRIGGGAYTIIVISVGQHFRPFPLDLFIRRVLNIRKAIENLFLRSPDTKVIIKSENTREINSDVERFSNFHGYVQYLLVKDIFKGLNVGVIDAWDMSTAYGSYNAHPPETVIKNQINLFLSYIS